MKGGRKAKKNKKRRERRGKQGMRITERRKENKEGRKELLLSSLQGRKEGTFTITVAFVYLVSFQSPS
jgi:hypothetical protein